MPPRYAYGNVIERGKTRTIMAYSTRAREARVNYYSSPYGTVMNALSQTFQPMFFAVKFDGKFTGSHKANNAQRLTEVKFTKYHY